MRASIPTPAAAARLASSSPVSGTASRRPGSSAEIAAASARIRSTGRRAEPATIHPTAVARTRATGPPTAKSTISPASASSRSSSEEPTTRTRSPVAGSARSLAETGSSTVRTVRSTNSARSSERTASARRSGVPASPADDASTVPSDAKICANASSGSARPAPPARSGASSSVGRIASPRDRSPASTASVRSARSRTYTNAPTPARITAIRAAVTMVSLVRRAIVLAQPVPSAPYGLDRLPAEGPVDLLPQVPHVHVHNVGVAVVGEVPHVLDQPASAQDLAGMAGEVLEQRELLRGELDRHVAPGNPSGGRIHRHVADAKRGGALRCAAPHQRPQPGQQLRE